MKFVHHDLGQRKSGEIVEITLSGNAACRSSESAWNRVHGLHQGQVPQGCPLGTVVEAQSAHAAVLGSWTGPFLQEIPLHLELADLLVQASCYEIRSP